MHALQTDDVFCIHFRSRAAHEDLPNNNKFYLLMASLGYAGGYQQKKCSLYIYIAVVYRCSHSPCTPYFGSRGGVSGSTSFWPAPGVF
jgi:hypothetical protein